MNSSAPNAGRVNSKSSRKNDVGKVLLQVKVCEVKWPPIPKHDEMRFKMIKNYDEKRTL